jgi:hypothetical protein
MWRRPVVDEKQNKKNMFIAWNRLMHKCMNQDDSLECSRFVRARHGVVAGGIRATDWPHDVGQRRRL